MKHALNRRQFAQGIASAALASSVLHVGGETRDHAVGAAPFPLSVMLWTVYNDLPFEERIARVAAAGYTNIEMVGEYAKWSDADFARADAAGKRLGLRFDATAGLHNGIGDPAVRSSFLAELKEALTPMERLACPAMIVLSGNVVPGLSREAQHASCVEGLKRAASLWKDAGLMDRRCGCCWSASTRKRIRIIFCNRRPKPSRSSAQSIIHSPIPLRHFP